MGIYPLFNKDVPQCARALPSAASAAVMIPACYRGWMAGNRRNGPFGIEIELSSERTGLSVQGKPTEYPWPAPRT